MVVYRCEHTENPTKDQQNNILLTLQTPTKHWEHQKEIELNGKIQIKLDSSVVLDLIEKLRSKNIIGDLRKLRISLAME